MNDSRKPSLIPMDENRPSYTPGGKRSRRSLPISAIVVGLNEGHLLEGCLSGISFCSEIIYVDLGSSDNSREIAESFGARCRTHAKVPSGEHVVAGVYPDAENDWILFLDPDEHVEPQLKSDVVKVFQEQHSNHEIGSFSAPWLFHFRGKRLFGTPWGGRRPRPFIAHRERFIFLPETHRGRILRDGFSDYNVSSKGSIMHFWSSSWLTLIRKHFRYLTTEGGSRYRRGDRISLGGAIARVPGIFYSTFRYFSNRKDGITGVGLNLVWSFYKSIALFALWLHSRRVKNQIKQERP